ncbi:MAG TPA: galactokinase [Nocardioides sp.]|uniref:galactokinase n=1 Tax=Nocardioides sp. TaxID=35761 RepID=UPI002E37CF06|nr:galactokinase [Nocardioides sp.]HEX5090408.1 galactokinase [Nocardioides sp.]
MTLVDPGDPGELAASVRSTFADRYGEPPTSLARAPGRVNLIGEHTDYNAGLVLPVALPHATYAAARPRADELVRLVSRQREETWEGTLGQLGPGSVEGWAGYAAGVVWALREAGYDVPGVDLLVDSRVPVGAGLSSSAALECSVGVALLDLAGTDPAEHRQQLVDACIRAETEVVGAPTGGMDQTVAVHGVAGAALLIDFESHETEAVPLDLARHTLLVTDTRVAHELTDGGYGSRRADCEEAVRELGVPTLRAATLEAVEALADDRVRRRARHVVTEIGRVRDTVANLGDGDWDEVGRIFDASHRSMRADFEISCPELDCAVAVAVQAGAVAARMTGGGFGGSTVAVVPDERVDAVMRAVDAAFVLEGFRSPVHLRAVPSAGAGLVPN